MKKLTIKITSKLLKFKADTSNFYSKFLFLTKVLWMYSSSKKIILLLYMSY